MPMNRPTWVESMMMRRPAAWHRADQPRRLRQIDRVQGGLQRGLADHGVIDATGPEFHLVVVAAHRLRDEREAQDGHRRVPGQPGGAAQGPGQPVLGVDGRAEVGADGAHATAAAVAARPISSLRTRTFWPTGPARRLSAADQQVARYR